MDFTNSTNQLYEDMHTNKQNEQNKQDRHTPPFKTNMLNSLYDIVHSQEIKKLTTTHDIYMALYKPIMAVVKNKVALEESYSWKDFDSVLKHHFSHHHEYINMNIDESMCFSLFMNIHH
jgi:hypothetical protein